MIKPFVNTLEQYASLTTEEINLITGRIEFQSLKKGNLFLEAGDLSQRIGFILSGVFRLYTINEDGKEITLLFFKEGDFLVDIDSFHDETPSLGNLQAETDAELLVISKTSWQFFETEVRNWHFIAKRMSQDALIDDLRFQRKLIDQEAIDSYKDFLEQYPTIAQRVPDHHLASYMGITKHSLSRIRKKMASEKKS